MQNQYTPASRGLPYTPEEEDAICRAVLSRATRDPKDPTQIKFADWKGVVDELQSTGMVRTKSAIESQWRILWRGFQEEGQEAALAKYGFRDDGDYVASDDGPGIVDNLDNEDLPVIHNGEELHIDSKFHYHTWNTVLEYLNGRADDPHSEIFQSQNDPLQEVDERWVEDSKHALVAFSSENLDVILLKTAQLDAGFAPDLNTVFGLLLAILIESPETFGEAQSRMVETVVRWRTNFALQQYNDN